MFITKVILIPRANKGLFVYSFVVCSWQSSVVAFCLEQEYKVFVIVAVFTGINAYIMIAASD